VRRAVLAGLEITREVAGSASRPSAGSASKSLSGWGCIAGWCIWTPPRTTCTGWPRISLRGWRVWQRRARWSSRRQSSPLIDDAFEFGVPPAAPVKVWTG